MCMKLKRFAFFTQKVIILSFLATRTKKEQSFTRPSSLKKKVAKQYHHTMADYSHYTWVVSRKVGASRGRNIKRGDLKLSGQTKKKRFISTTEANLMTVSSCAMSYR